MQENKPQEHRSTTAIWGVLWSAFDILIPTVVGFAVFVLTSRFLTPAEFGTVALAGSITLFGSALCPAGFGAALIQKLEISEEDLSTVFWLCLASAVVVYAIEAALAVPVARYFKVEALKVLIPVLALRVLPEMAAVVPNALISKSLSFRTFALRTLFVSLLASALAILLLLHGFGIWALVASQVMTTVVSSLVAFWAVRWRPKFLFHTESLRRLGEYGMYASGSRTMGQLVAQNEIMFVGAALGIGQVGLYNFAKRLFSTLNDVVGGALSSVAHPFLSGIQNDVTRVRSAFLSATFASSVIAFPLFIGLAVLADRLIPLVFGARWIEAVGLVRLQSALGIIACIGVLQGALITARGKAKWWFIYQLFSTLTTFALIAVLARQGTEIMLASIVIKAYATWVIPVNLTLKLLQMRVGEYLPQFISPLVACVVMALSIYAERWALHVASPWFALALDVATGAVCYLGCITLFEHRRIGRIAQIMFPRLRSALASS